MGACTNYKLPCYLPSRATRETTQQAETEQALIFGFLFWLNFWEEINK